jgi:hypothetical protein
MLSSSEDAEMRELLDIERSTMRGLSVF